jgi:hypothetical protein
VLNFYKKIKSARKHVQRLKCWGSFRRLEPFSKVFGYDRGSQSIARYYIDEFMYKNASDIQGTVMEIGDDTYTKRLGNNIIKNDVLHVEEGNPKATIVTDLTNDSRILNETYDCIIIPQTFQFIYDFRSALLHCHRILKPKGVLLATLSGISQISRYDMNRWGDYWRFTSLSATKLFEEFFLKDNITVEVYGNVLTAVAFLEGLASRELNKSEFNFKDPDYEVIISVRAIKK